MKNKFPGVESISLSKKHSSDLVTNYNAIKTLAPPRILSSFAPFNNVKRNSSSTSVDPQSQPYPIPVNAKLNKLTRYCSLELGNNPIKKKSQFFKPTENKIDNIDKELPPEEMELKESQEKKFEDKDELLHIDKEENILLDLNKAHSGFVCLCGKIIISEDAICNECKANKSQIVNYKEAYLYQKKLIGILDKQYIIIKDKQIFFYKDSTTDQLTSIYNLINTFLVNTLEEIQHDGKSLFGFTLRSEFKTLSLYSESATERGEFVSIIKNVTKLGNIHEFYEFQGTLGKGRFGEVKEAMNKLTNEKVAVKVLKKENMSEKDKEKIRVEVDILKFCKNDGIIRFYDFFENEEWFYIVIEYVSGGDFFTYFKNFNYNITEQHSIRIIHSLLGVIKYLHRYGIIHRDIKPENILLTSKDVNACIKLSDFGLAQLLGPKQYCPDFCGTVVFAAPEALQGKKCGKELDLWSCGVFAYYLLSGGYLPFYSKNDQATIKYISY